MVNVEENNLIDIEFINPNIEDLEQKENLFKQLQDQGLYPTDLTIKKTRLSTLQSLLKKQQKK